MDLSPEARVELLASRQAGCISRGQAHAAGFHDNAIARRVSTGRWTRVHSGIYVLVSVPHSWEQDVWSAALAAGRRTEGLQDVAVTHESALLLHGLDARRLPRYPITLTVPNGRHPRVAGADIHQVDDLASHHVAEIVVGSSGVLPVSRPARALVDLAATSGKVHLGNLLDDLVTARLLTLADVAGCLTEVARPGKRGLSTLGAVLDDRGPGYVPPASELERLLFQAIAVAGLPEPMRQFPLPGRHPRREVVDAAYPDAMIIVEADGRRWHSRLRDVRRDHARDAEASLAGWITLRFTYEEIALTPDEVTATISGVRATRLAQLHPAKR